MKTLTKIINKKEMTFSSESDEKGEFYALPILSKQSKVGKEMRWKIIVRNVESYGYSADSFAFRSFHWQEPNGKIKESEWTIVQPKNIGKSNETTPFDQALFQAYSQWQKKQEQQQYILLGENTEMKTDNQMNPMLANKYINQGKKYLKEPFAISRKLDGIRAIAKMNDKGQIEMFTRNGKRIHHLHRVKLELEKLLSENNAIILDGELYSHSLSFNDITGAVRAQKNPSINDDRIEYWIFDIIDVNKSYLERSNQLRTIFNNQNNVIKFVDYILCNHKEVKQYHDTFVQEGFEGLMARDLQSKYEHARSNYLLKYKEFTDEEFEIVSITTGVGSEAGAILFECKTENGALFTVRPRGTLEHRKLMFKNEPTEYIGKRLTVRYQERDNSTTIPRFPVGITIRDYE